MAAAKCARCNGEIGLKGHGGNCKHCGVPYCKDCWSGASYCNVCNKAL